MRASRLNVLLIALAVFTALACAGRCEQASAKATIFGFSLEPVASQEADATQAGAHPDLLLHTFISSHWIEITPCECNDPKEIILGTPAGIVGTPSDVPECTAAEYASLACPSDTQVGLLVVGNSFSPVYNLIPRPGELALFGAVTPIVPTPTIFNSISVRTEGDYGLELKTTGINRELPVASDLKLITWGVPASSDHDMVRFPIDAEKVLNCFVGDSDPLPELLAGEFPETDCGPFRAQGKPDGTYLPIQPTPANSPAAPFLSSPTTCSGPLTTTLDTLAYDRETDHAEAPYPAIVGCDQLAFDPSLSAKPTTGEADAPSGVDIDVVVPQALSPAAPSPSAVHRVEIEFPPGFTINPNAADGKSACTAAQARFGTRETAQCPEFSKIGTLGVTSSSFPAVLPGAIYLGEPLPGNRYRIFLVFDGFSLHVKLASTATPDPTTGQLTVSLNDLPQFTFQEFDLHVFGAERGLLSTPKRCGTYPVKSTFIPWAAPHIPEQTSTQFFTIDSGPNGTPCPGAARPFDPTFDAGVTDATAGKHTTFTVDLKRPDGDQNLTGLNVTTPPGFAATLKGIPYCSEAAIARLQNSLYTGLSELASASCSAESQIGTATAAAGSGSRPLYVGGKVYLAGPYKGSPLSLLVVIPAVSGPYDLGNVAVRAAISVDPKTAQVTTASDPLPQILEGIPLRTRQIRVDLDRPDFALNPTNCDPFSVDAKATGDEGASADLSTHFQIANCAALPFEPELTVKVLGATKRIGHPRLRAVFKGKDGEANLAKTVVALPHSEFLDSTHIRSVCTRADFAADSCPPGSIYGRAAAFTPILDQPLRGPVYLRSSGKPLPDLVADLHGQFDFELSGQIDTDNRQGIRTTFGAVPDVPVSKFVLNMQGGRKGLLQNSRDLCRNGAGRATVQMDGQNGAIFNFRPKLLTSCEKKRKRKAHRRHRRANLHRARRAVR